MHRIRISSGHMLCVAAAIAAPALTAQGLPPGTTVSSAAISGIAQFDTDFDRGGSFHWAGVLASGSVLRQFTPQIAAGLSLSYAYESWHFDNPAAFGGQAPWSSLNRPQIGATLLYAPDQDWQILVAPSVEWDYESGASAGDAVTYGAVLSAAKTFSPGLRLGLGVAAFRQIYRNRFLAFPVIDWKIDDKWSLKNPLQAGPAGGAGLELTYAINDATEIGVGGSYRSFLYRLDRDGPVSNGIGQVSYVPVFLRVSYRFTPRVHLDFYAAALTGGKLTVKNEFGNDVTNDEFKTAPAVGLTLRGTF